MCNIVISQVFVLQTLRFPLCISILWGINCRTADFYTPDLGCIFIVCRSSGLHNPFIKCFSFSLIHRNNLTVIDAIMVQGQGTTESLKVAGKPPGPGSSLRFKITEALLKDCSESEYFVSYCAEQKRNSILCLQLKMSANISFPHS